MAKEIIKLKNVKAPASGFSHAVKAGNTIYLSSQLSADLQTGEIIPGDIEAQTIKAMENIKLILAQCGCNMDDIAKVVIYFRNVSDRRVINEAYRQYFTPGQQPAKVSVQAPSPIEGIDVEIEATAVIS